MKDLIISREGKQWNIFDYNLYLENKLKKLEEAIGDALKTNKNDMNPGWYSRVIKILERASEDNNVKTLVD